MILKPTIFAKADAIRRFQLHLAETGLSICKRNGIMTGDHLPRLRIFVVGFAPDPTGIITNFKYLARTRIFEFESAHQRIGSL
jgi:hypothetical protein